MPFWRVKFQPNVGAPTEVQEIPAAEARRPEAVKGPDEWMSVVLASDRDTAITRACESLGLVRIRTWHERIDEI